MEKKDKKEFSERYSKFFVGSIVLIGIGVGGYFLGKALFTKKNDSGKNNPPSGSENTTKAPDNNQGTESPPQNDETTTDVPIKDIVTQGPNNDGKGPDNESQGPNNESDFPLVGVILGSVAGLVFAFAVFFGYRRIRNGNQTSRKIRKQIEVEEDWLIDKAVEDDWLIDKARNVRRKEELERRKVIREVKAAERDADFKLALAKNPAARRRALSEQDAED